MTTVLIVIHLMVVVAMIGLVLLQRSEGGALGIGGGGSGAFMTGRGAANMLTRSTAGLAIAFFATSILLTLIARWQSGPIDIFQNLPGSTAPVTEEQAPAPAPSIPASGGTAEEMLRGLGGSAGPQTPPADSGAETPAGSEAPTPAGEDAAAGGGGAEPPTPPQSGQ